MRSQFPPPENQWRGILLFEIWTKSGVMKTFFRNRGLVERGGAPLRKRRFPNCFIRFPSEKQVFIRVGFFCLVNVHACCNQQIYSFMRLTFFQRMIYYEIYFPLTLNFNYNFVKISLLMTFISISIFKNFKYF